MSDPGITNRAMQSTLSELMTDALPDIINRAVQSTSSELVSDARISNRAMQSTSSMLVLDADIINRAMQSTSSELVSDGGISNKRMLISSFESVPYAQQSTTRWNRHAHNNGGGYCHVHDGKLTALGNNCKVKNMVCSKQSI